MRIDIAWVYSLIAAVLVFFVSLILVPYYVLGDQEFYILAYNGVSDLPLAEAFSYYKSKINSVEYLHFFSIWIASRILDKTIYVSILNFLLALFGGRLLIFWGAKWYVSVFIVLTNYYFWVMYIPAERLKLAFIILFFALLVRGWLSKLFFLVMSLAAHASILLMIALNSVSSYLFFNGRFRFDWRLLIVIFFALIGSALVFDQLHAKLYGYYQNYRTTGFGMYYKTGLLFMLSLFYARVRFEVCVCFLLLILAVFFVGDGRVNMFSYFAFLYFSIHFRGGVNFGVLLTSIYFFYSSVEFFEMTMRFGTTDIEQIRNLQSW